MSNFVPCTKKGNLEINFDINFVIPFNDSVKKVMNFIFEKTIFNL